MDFQQNDKITELDCLAIFSVVVVTSPMNDMTYEAMKKLDYQINVIPRTM